MENMEMRCDQNREEAASSKLSPDAFVVGLRLPSDDHFVYR